MAASGFLKNKTNDSHVGYVQETGIVMPTSATTTYSSDIAPSFAPNSKFEKRNAGIVVQMSELPAANVEINLFGSIDGGTTKVKITPSALGTLTTAVIAVGATVDMNFYPFPYIYVGFTSSGSETGKTGIVTLSTLG